MFVEEDLRKDDEYNNSEVDKFEKYFIEVIKNFQF